MDEALILEWLRCDDPRRLEDLYAHADRVRDEQVGDEVHLRGLIEVSNHCVRSCSYCGLRSENRELRRYRMSSEEILASALEATSLGYGTVVLQAGEDYGIRTAWLANIIRRIKTQTDLAVTLSMGERPEADLAKWREAGADRYLLRFETSDRRLYDEIHPPLGDECSDRFEELRYLRHLGYEIGSGVMIGIPGQSYESLAHDILLFSEIDLDMIGVGPYIPNPNACLGDRSPLASADQVPGTESMVYKVIALARLLCPEANIPATTALATLNRGNGRELALQRGANVVMPNVTPVLYRAQYEIYPNKVCINETARCCSGCIRDRIENISRSVAQGPGDRRRTTGRRFLRIGDTHQPLST